MRKTRREEHAAGKQQAQANNECLFFAYDRLMDGMHMTWHCPHAVKAGAARLAGYRFIINSDGRSSLLPHKHAAVHGILWSLPPQDATRLARHIGADVGIYDQHPVEVDCSTKQTHEVLTYRARNATPGHPIRQEMLDLINIATAQKFPIPYLLELVGWLRNDAPTMSWICSVSQEHSSSHN